MNYDIRQLCTYFPEIHSRYYVDTNGCVYTSLSPNTKRIMVDGQRVTVTTFVNNALPHLNRTNRQLEKFPIAKDYFLLYDGTILQRLKTTIKDNDEVVVRLVCMNDRKMFSLSRLVAGSFVDNVSGKEVHHLDRDRKNNSATNLRVMSFEEHRGKGNYKRQHNM